MRFLVFFCFVFLLVKRIIIVTCSLKNIYVVYMCVYCYLAFLWKCLLWCVCFRLFVDWSGDENEQFRLRLLLCFLDEVDLFSLCPEYCLNEDDDDDDDEGLFFRLTTDVAEDDVENSTTTTEILCLRMSTLSTLTRIVEDTPNWRTR